MRRLRIIAMIGVLAHAAAASAQQATPPASGDESDHSIVFELGAAGDWSSAEGFHPGGTVAFEVTPIEHWLEVEVGATALASGGGAEIPIDLLFKKPWQISRAFELMIGAGPELVHATGRDGGTFWGIEGVVDLMFWPRKNVGWYVEPGYEVTRRGGGNHPGIGVSGGLLLGR